MNLFYCESIHSDFCLLNEVESKHCVSVLRKKVGDIIHLFDGNGNEATAIVHHIGKKMVQVKIEHKIVHKPAPYHLHIAVAPTKNRSKIEWFVEKAIEFGIQELSFFYSTYSERNKMNMERINKIILSASKQSKSYYLPKVNELHSFQDFIEMEHSQTRKVIATLHEQSKPMTPYKNEQILCVIGPEGGFSNEEIESAIFHGYETVTLGNKRLRTETAALFFGAMYYQIHLKS